ncbi:nuclear transport factor 2 family protein [Actinoallomurus spadix]|uniref:SnoaL-like domain-containing protein n=1 Tax=Actinoallomurus spadix TaxID=79912 RepID=A0ABP3FUL0_9ACTN|nr:nuclear transport factor 2 family protein [Actinoallomurus spadix]MCO5986216.1 nuclear transport factor 2 family protein [Actinoallomurus spadix]
MGKVGERDPVGHHLTNVVLDGQADDRVHARSKGIGIYANGTSGSMTYEDVIVRVKDGWRISHRKVLARRSPLGG